MRKSLLLLVMAWAALMLPCQLVQAAPLTFSDEVFVGFRPDCDGPRQNLDLGKLTATLDFAANPASAEMHGYFTTSAAAQASGIWNCMKLHYLQIITQDDDPAKYKGNPLPRANHSVVDPPNGGWDYMYKDGAGRKNPDPAYKNFIDDKPWYWNSAGEVKYFTTCKEYDILDFPTIPRPPKGGSTTFITYLVADAPGSVCDEPYCLQPGEILLLAEYKWVISSNADGSVRSVALNAIATPNANDVNLVTDGLSEAGFTGYTPVVDKDICCPEPATWTLLVFGAAGLSVYGYRRRASAQSAA
jgi:hypothetical protein